MQPQINEKVFRDSDIKLLIQEAQQTLEIAYANFKKANENRQIFEANNLTLR